MERAMTQIKICGITNVQEITVLNEMQVEYAGFVFFEKSKRNISLEKAAELKKALLPVIKTVAVTVSPNGEIIQQITDAGFDILQIHGELSTNVWKQISIPVWRAVNISDAKAVSEKIAAVRPPDETKITGYVIDGAEYGSGKTFHWEQFSREPLAGKTFILAGGLKARNVSEAIRIFAPDVVDVSSGVEGKNGKDKDKIKAFVRKVREHG